MRQRQLVRLSLVSLALTACSGSSTPAGLYRVGGVEQSSCAHSVRLLRARPREAFEELASLSATCPYPSPNTCERRLLARACDLAADAVVVEESRVIGRKGKPELAEEAIAIRFAVKSRVP